MKKTIYSCCLQSTLLKAILLAMLVCVGVNGGAQEWLWAQSAGSSAHEGVKYMVTDQFNNVYVGMFLSSDGSGGTLHFNTGTYVCNGSSDMFIVKYDPNGNELWVRQLGGDNPSWPESYSEYMTGLKYDEVTNSLYVTGIFYESCDFGNGIVLNGWYQDIFFARFDMEGNCLWAKRAGSYGNEYASAIGTDEMGMLFVTTALTRVGQIDTASYDYGGYLSKYTPEGSLLFTKKIHQDIIDVGPAINIREIKSKDGFIYLYGNNIYYLFNIDTITCGMNNYQGEILACLSAEGSALWLKQFGGPVFRNISLTFSMDDQKNFYFTGSFEGDIATFGNDTITSTASSRELFIYKCDSEGNTVWIQQANANNRVIGEGIFISENEDVFIIGGIMGNAVFGEYAIQSLTMEDIFLVRYNSSGICLSAEILGEGYGRAVSTLNDNTMIAGGSFLNTIIFGNTVLTSNGYYDAFIAKRELITGNGNNDKAITERLLIYANPSTGICNISIPEELQHEENLTLLVYDNAGKLILQQVITMQEEKISLNLQAEAKGVYNAILTNGKQKFQGKVVVE